MADKKPILLFVDDEERILRTLEMSFRQGYQVLTTTNGHQALRMLKEYDVDVIISDQRMPLISGAEVLRAAREISPGTMRILLTGYSDLAGIIGSINEGEIFRYVQKPWRLGELKSTIDEAISIARASRAEAAVKSAETITKTGSVVVLHSKKSIAQFIFQEKPELNVGYATKLDDALALLEQDPNAVLLTDLILQEGSICEGLSLLKQGRPQLVVIVITAFTDTSQLVNLINSAQVYRVLPMPVSKTVLLNSLDSALRHQQILSNRPALLRRHMVQASAPETSKDSASIIHRVRGYLDRMRATA